MLSRGKFACGKISVYHLSEKVNSSLFEFLPKIFEDREREREREDERETWFCHDKCHHHLSPMIMSCIEKFPGMRNTSFIYSLQLKKKTYGRQQTNYKVKMQESLAQKSML